MNQPNYIIKITGNGTSKQIEEALRGIADSINEARRSENEFGKLDGSEWEDKTLFTVIRGEVEVKIVSITGKGCFVIPESNRDTLIEMGLITTDGVYDDKEWESVSEAIKKMK